MEFRAINDRAAIEAFLRQNSPWHPYALADLDDFFWPATRWHAALVGDRIVAVCFVITKVSPPVFYAIAPPGDEATLELAAAVQSTLPDRVFAHLGLELTQTAQLIGLNVQASNAPAIGCYERLGFTKVGRYVEGTLVRRNKN